MQRQSFSQFQQCLTQSSILARVPRVRFECFDVPEQRVGIVCVEIKNNHVESGVLEEGVASAGVSVAELFEFCLHEFVSLFSMSELQWCTSTEGVFRLGQPTVGFCFVAKYKLGLALDQLSVLHFLVL